jgi:hypothetical protein
MAIRHKFYDWLSLSESKVDWEVRILIIGTFNPDIDSANYASWFYGRTRKNHLWQILPELMGEESLKEGSKREWIAFCRRNKIAFTDLISEIPNADINNEEHLKIISGFKDQDIINEFGSIDQLIWTDVNRIIRERNSIKEVYLTNSGNDIWGGIFDDIASNNEALYFRKLYTPSNFAGLHMTRAGFNSVTEFIKYKWNEKGFLLQNQ